MAEDRSLKAPQRPESQGTKDGSMASAADIPRPSARILREEEAAAGQQQYRPRDKTNAGPSLQEVIRLRLQMEREGRKVHRSDPALMEFMKHQQGDEMAAELLAATAAMMAAMPEKKKEKKKRLHQLYFQWARQVSTSVITRVIQSFKLK